MAYLYDDSVHHAPANLREIASTASFIATSFYTYTTYLKREAVEIRDVIAKCFAIASKLQLIADILEQLTDGRLRRYNEYSVDIRQCALSLKYTFEAIEEITGQELSIAIREFGYPRKSPNTYRHVWSQINERLMEESGNRLARRLEYGVEFLSMLVAVLEGSKGSYTRPVDQGEFDDLSDRVERLFLSQEQNQTTAGARPTILDDSPSPSPPYDTSLSKPPSFERHRPSTPIEGTFPYPVTSPPPRDYQRPQRPARRPSINSFASSSSASNFNRVPPHNPRQPHRPSFGSGGPMAEPGWDPRGFRRGSGGMPPAPEPPRIVQLRSPSVSSSVFESSESPSCSSEDSAFGGGEAAGREETGDKAWVTKVFERSPAASPLPATGRSACFDQEIADERGVLQKLKQEYNLLTELKFENGEITVRIYQRYRDCRVHFFLRTHHPHKRPKIYIVSLTSLIVSRHGSILKFEKLDQGVYRDWAHLRFRTYEELTIFHTLFLSLRSMDDSSHRLSTPIEDASPLHHESRPFSAAIIDDRYHHTLSILSDRDTGAVRLLASVHRGSLRKTPVWTAFVTHLMHSPSWMRRMDHKVVQLAELAEYVFHEDYTPMTVAEGGAAGVELVFVSAEEADAFMETIAHLASPPSKPHSKPHSKSKDKEKDKDHHKGKDAKRGKEVKFDKGYKDDKYGKKDGKHGKDRGGKDGGKDVRRGGDYMDGRGGGGGNMDGGGGRGGGCRGGDYMGGGGGGWH